MKNISKLSIFIILFFPLIVIAGKGGFSIKVKITGLKDTSCYLANYYGEKQYIKDTAKVDANGRFEFKGDDALPGGIYLVVMPNKKYFEIIVDKEQFFSIETDTIDFYLKMKIKGSAENLLFCDYMKFIISQQKIADPLREKLKTLKDNKDSTKILQEKLNNVDKAVKDFKLKFMKDHPAELLSKVFKCSQDIELPDPPTLPNGKKDSAFVYRYYKAHFFDNVDFNDERLLRTPVFPPKISQYYNNVVLQHPDTLIKDADALIERAKDNKEVFKYIVWYITNQSESSKVMGMDAVFVHMVETYYMTNRAYWVSAAILQKMTDRAMQIKPILLGKKAPNLVMYDLNWKEYELHKIEGKYTILYFWDPDCGHCQKETPKLGEYYKKVKSQGVVVYAVGSIGDVKPWEKYIKDHDLNWLNVIDAKNNTKYKHIYDIYSTPVIYLLDENKNILAKRISVDQLEEMLNNRLKKDQEKK